jgi:hypothetical protein
MFFACVLLNFEDHRMFLDLKGSELSYEAGLST